MFLDSEAKYFQNICGVFQKHPECCQKEFVQGLGILLGFRHGPAVGEAGVFAVQEQNQGIVSGEGAVPTSGLRSGGERGPCFGVRF